MGCDIHVYTEKKVGGFWVTADEWVDDKYEPGQKTQGRAIYNGRSYNLFSILANVRNGYGFAGVKTGRGFVPIADPRGIPEDACVEYKIMHERWGCDGHSHSYLTLAELLAYDWTQRTTLCGWVGITEWARFRDYGRPDSWSGGVSGGNVTHLGSEQFEQAWQTLRAEQSWPEQRLASTHLNTYQHNEDASKHIVRMVELLGGGSPYTHVSWELPYYEAIDDGFFGKTIPQLLKLAQDCGGHDNARLVFFFDN